MDSQECPRLPESPEPPQPMRSVPAWRRMIGPVGVVLVVGGSMLTIVASSFTRLSGATRSRKLEFQRRKQAIEQVIQKAGDETSVVTDTQEPHRPDDSVSAG